MRAERTPAPGSGRRRRDRHGRGLRGSLAPPSVPLHRTPAEHFDELVLDAVEHLEQHWGAELTQLEFAVEEVPDADTEPTDGADIVFDRGVALGRLYRAGLPEIPQPVVVVYRRPVEARASEREDKADLVLMVVADLAGGFLGRDPGDVDDGAEDD